ncbi:MAG: hypothetical protein J5521_00840 [Lachnospiraceae bacterium]|nr:hypothetical protein [Lachnospiraceae bacterium]MBR4414972.1 hypothetical protein [Aeriscardovia sp.]
MDKYSTLLSSVTKLFDVNDDLKNELNSIAIEQHNKSLNELIEIWAKDNSSLNDEAYIELNQEPYSITDMQELYDFVYGG